MTAADRTEAVVEEVLIDASPETVFEFFLEANLMRKWMGGHATLEPWVGGVFAVDIGDNRARGNFVEVVAGERVVFTWGWEQSTDVPPGSSVVTFTLEPRGKATLLRMVHEGLPAGEDIRHQQGWVHYFDRLRQAATGIDPGPDAHAAGGETAMYEPS